MIGRSLSSRIRSVAWSAILAFLIIAFGQGVWGALLFANLRTGLAIPWAVAVMPLVLWLMWQYLGGKGWPHRTSETRRRYLRANRVSGQAWTWAMLAGGLSIVALAGYWIVMFQLVQMPANVLPDLSKYPMLTVVLMPVMASLVSPINEESAFRGYCQVILEREFRGVVAVIISSLLFALAHLTQGFLWPKLLVYFLVGLVFGAMAYLTGSILPGIAVHIIGDLTFFALVWPYDAQRHLVWKSGADRWFWLHTLQAIIFTPLALIAFRRLASLSHRPRAIEDNRVLPGSSSEPAA
jgi:membrane protease YdiL (CAAX protease family)